MKNIVFVFLFISSVLHAHLTGDRSSCDIHKLCVLQGSGKVHKSFIPPLKSAPESRRNIRFLGENVEEEPKLSLFESNYSENTPLDAKVAIEYALSLWERYIHSEVNILIEINWVDEEDGTTLATAAPINNPYMRGNPQIPAHFGPVSIANKKARTDLYPFSSDIKIDVYGKNQFYFGTDGDCPINKYDLVSVILHEIGHGLGFHSSASKVKSEESEDESELKGAWSYGTTGLGAPFDFFIENNSKEKMVDPDVFQSGTHEAYEYLTSGQVFFRSSFATAANSGLPIKLWAPSEWNDGSSISHLDENRYSTGNENSLMSPSIGKGEAIHDPGPLTIAVLKEIGWDHLWIEHSQLFDTEDTTSTIEVRANIESDTPMSENPILSVRKEGMQDYVESVMILDTVTGQYVGEIPNSGMTEVWSYFLTGKGSNERIFYYPTKGPNDPIEFTVGPDLKIPYLWHKPEKFLWASQNRFFGFFIAEDNTSLGNVFVEWWLDGVQQSNVQLSLANSPLFVFEQTIPNMERHQMLEYRIFAIDASAAKNGTLTPAEGRYQLPIRTLLPATNRYSTVLFENDTDFILDGFEIKQSEGFDNLYLGTPHPYLNNGDKIDYYAYLRHPFVIEEKASINFFEVVLIEPGEEGSEFGESAFYDYAAVEISKDNGISWVALDGWDSRAREDWLNLHNQEIVNQVSTAKGNATMYVPRVIQLDQTDIVQAGDEVLIRFHLHSDPYTTAWGWAIDNISIGVHE